MAVVTLRDIGVDGLLSDLGDGADGLFVIAVADPAGPAYDAFVAVV